MKSALYLINIDSFNEINLAKAFSLIDPSRKEKALHYLRESDKLLSVGGGLLIAMLGGEKLVIAKHGKPYFEKGPKFSISHSGKFVGIYAASDEVGLDIQVVELAQKDRLRGFFTEEECKGISNAEDFAVSWARKEAAAKCLGDGLFRPSEDGVSKQNDGCYDFQGHLLFLKEWVYRGHAVVIASESPIPSDVEIREITVDQAISNIESME